MKKSTGKDIRSVKSKNIEPTALSGQSKVRDDGHCQVSSTRSRMSRYEVIAVQPDELAQRIVQSYSAGRLHRAQK